MLTITEQMIDVKIFIPFIKVHENIFIHLNLSMERVEINKFHASEIFGGKFEFFVEIFVFFKSILWSI